MGLTIWVEVRGRPIDETSYDLSFMHDLIKPLDRLAAGLGVPAISGFLDFTALEREAGEFLDPPAEGEGGGEAGAMELDALLDAAADADGRREGGGASEETLEERQAVGKWFDSAAGLAAVRAVREHLRANPKAVKLGVPAREERRYRNALMNDLRRCERMLAKAAAEGRQFRLLIVP